MKTNELMQPFGPVSARQWKQQIQADLKGGDYNELLTWTSPEGIHVKPIYTEEDRPGSGGGSGLAPDQWEIGQLVNAAEDEDPASTVRTALEGGVDRLLIELPTDGSAAWLAQASPEGGHIFELDAPFPDLPNLVADGEQKGNEWRLDPIGNLVQSGNWSKGREADLQSLAQLVSDGRSGNGTVHLSIRADHYQQAGADRVQELAYALSHIHEYVQLADAYGDLKPLLQNPVFRVAIGGEYFMEIAKLRALRGLWQLLARASGLPGTCRITAVPSLRNKTLYDYNTNMIRTAAECMAGVLGGADLVCNLPYDSVYHKPNAFADRMARNQLLLLRHEAYFAEVSNPADGAYYIEALTDQLGKKALELFKTLEKGGGFLAQLKRHTIQRKIRESAAEDQRAFDAGERVLVGSNVFADPSQLMAAEQQKPLREKRSGKTLLEPLPVRRLSEAYELKRLQDEPR